MIEIIPAIMPEDLSELRNKLALIRGAVTTVQLDLMDGKFVKARTWPYNNKEKELLSRILNEEEGLPFWDEFDFEFDLMVKDAKDDLDTFMRLGARRIIFHIEAEDQTGDNFLEFLEGIDMYVRENTEIGVAIDIATPIEKIFPLIPHIDFVQCMGIDKDGVQGSPFDEHAIDHVKALHEKYPDLIISVDGGVNFETASALIQAGATRLVIGSAIWKSFDVVETVKDFQYLGEEESS